MSKIVFFCIPAYGHTNPTLEVVKALISKGNEVLYYSFNMMKEKIESTGGTFISCDKYNNIINLTNKDASRISKDLGFSIKVIADTTLAMDKDICRELEMIKPDCIVADSMAFWGKMIAKKLNIPFVSSTTTFAFNRYSAKIMKKGFKELLAIAAALPEVNRQIKRLKKNGYNIKNIFDIIGNDNNTDTIVYTSRMFQPFAETFSDKYAFVGPSIRPISEPVQKIGDKLIYISMGTVNNDMIEFYNSCIKALKNTEYQVIMSVGNNIDIGTLGEIPENISVMPAVDQMAVLSVADVFISHCGMNSVNESLYFAVPLIMMPQTSEQWGVCERVIQLGAGIRLEKTSSADIKAMVDKVLSDETFYKNAKLVSEDLKKCSGAEGAADKILEVCSNKGL